MSLLKASLTSSSPLTDVILNRGNSANVVLESQPKEQSAPIAGEQISPTAFANVGLKVTVQRSTGKVLNAQPKEDFMKVLYGIFSFRLGRAELLTGGTSFKAINSLYRSVVEFIDDKYFKKGMKTRLIKPDFPRNNVGTGLFFGQRSYLLMDDLTVVPFSVMSTVSAIREQKIPISDVEEMVLQIGQKEVVNSITVCNLNLLDFFQCVVCF